jgi:hypothetical protein
MVEVGMESTDPGRWDVQCIGTSVYSVAYGEYRGNTYFMVASRLYSIAAGSYDTKDYYSTSIYYIPSHDHSYTQYSILYIAIEYIINYRYEVHAPAGEPALHLEASY